MYSNLFLYLPHLFLYFFYFSSFSPFISLFCILTELLLCTLKNTVKASKQAVESSDASSAAWIAGKSESWFGRKYTLHILK